MTRALKIAPSVLAANFGRLAEEVRAIDKAGADWIHRHHGWAVRAGNLIRSRNRESDPAKYPKAVNLHMMVVEPERSLERYIVAGADHILVQAEPGSTVHLHRVLSQIRSLGARPGVVIDPATPVAWIEYVLHLVDIVLVMTVNPGFGGQLFLPEMLPKIAELRARCDARGLAPYIEVDGGQDSAAVRRTIEAGADVIVAGTAIFGAPDFAAAIASLRESSLRA